MDHKFARFRSQTTTVIAVLLVLFHLYTAAFGLLEAMSQRNIHLTAALLMVLLTRPAKNRYGVLVDSLLVAATIAAGIYTAIQAPTMALRAGTVYRTDIIFGLMTMVLILEGTRRLMGPAMPLVALAMVSYMFFGHHLPQPYGHPPYSLERITSIQYMTGEGIYGTPLGASASFIVLFIAFGAFLEASGGGRFFMDLSSLYTKSS
ncbi:MAG: hypothetical protein AB1447_12030 [Bacillota bacterium]